MSRFQRHVFVCVHERPADSPKGCCASKGAGQVVSELKGRLFDRGLNTVVRANETSCLSQCMQGVSMVVYPEGVWYGGVTVADLDELIDEHLVGGRVVERLVCSHEPGGVKG